MSATVTATFPGLTEIQKIINSIYSRPESSAFREPVDWKGMGLNDYLEIIKTPMDLGTIKKKIDQSSYNSVEEIANDVRLVWRNCMQYNCDGSEFYHVADTFARAFEESYTALLKLQGSEDVNRVPTIEEKIQLSYDIFKIDNVEMGRVLTMVESSCPHALARKTSVDEVLVNFDALTPACFHEINSFVCNCILQHSGQKQKKKRSSPVGGGASVASGQSGTKPKKSKH